MNWGKLLAALAALAGQLLLLFREKQARERGAEAQITKATQEALNDVEVAQAARRDVDAVVAREPDRLRDDDGFKRRTGSAAAG